MQRLKIKLVLVCLLISSSAMAAKETRETNREENHARKVKLIPAVETVPEAPVSVVRSNEFRNFRH